MKNLKSIIVTGILACSLALGNSLKSYGQTEINYLNMDSLKYKSAQISKFMQESSKKDFIEISQLNPKIINVKYSELEKIEVILEDKLQKNSLKNK